jgi:hypothetical protein
VGVDALLFTHSASIKTPSNDEGMDESVGQVPWSTHVAPSRSLLLLPSDIVTHVGEVFPCVDTVNCEIETLACVAAKKRSKPWT